MDEHVHFIPVGFDFERLIFPISKGDMEADRVILFQTKGDSEENRARELAGGMIDRLEDSFGLVDVSVELRNFNIDKLYDYEGLYPEAYEQILDELDSGSEVYVNISSMPRTVAFAFATAADSIVTEEPDYRDKLHTYYVAPEDYLVLEMIEALERNVEFLRELYAESENFDLYHRIEESESLLKDIRRNGVTRGAEEMPDGRLYVEFPASPGGDLEGFEGELLVFLYKSGPMDSTSKLAEGFADYLGEQFDESFRGRVQYYVRSLDEDGYIERIRRGNRFETRLSTLGEMWAKIHSRSENYS